MVVPLSHTPTPCRKGLSPNKDSVLLVAKSLGVDLNTTSAEFEQRFKKTFMAKEAGDERNALVVREKYKAARFAGLDVADFINATLTSAARGILKQVEGSQLGFRQLLFVLVDKISSNKRLPRLDWAVDLDAETVFRPAKKVRPLRPPSLSPSPPAGRPYPPCRSALQMFVCRQSGDAVEAVELPPPPRAPQAVYLKDLYGVTTDALLAALQLGEAPRTEAWLGETPPSQLDLLLASVLEDARELVSCMERRGERDVAKRMRDQLCAATEVLAKKPKATV